MCAECHSTNLRKAYDAAADTYATRWDEINVCCQSCHGPGGAHQAWAEAKRDGKPAPSGAAKAYSLVDDFRARDSPFEVDACGACHFRDGSVEESYTSGQIMNGILLRMSVADGKGGWAPPAGYHSQLRDKAVAGVPPEGFGVIDWHEIPGRFPDGEAYSLRKPSFRVLNPAYGELPDGVIFEARSAPRLPGMGLLEAIDETTLLAIAKSQANHPDGVSGRPNWLTDPETGKRVIGKFSLKANSPHLRAKRISRRFPFAIGPLWERVFTPRWWASY